MKILSLILLVLTLALVGFNIYVGFIFKRPAITEPKAAEEIKKEIPQVTLEAGTMDLGKMTINLVNEKGKEPRYLQTTINLSYMTESKEEIESKRAALLDIVLNEISFRKISQLDTLNGKIDLKSKLIFRFNAVLKKTVVKDVYFDAFTIQ